MKEKPIPQNSESAKELDKLGQQFDMFQESVEKMTLDRMNEAPKLETEPLVKMSSSEIARTEDIYLKPFRSIGSAEKFNENYRSDYNHAKEYVRFQAENKEIIGETIDMWTKPFAGLPAEWWKIPVGKPLWAPRYVAEQISRCRYHRLTMKQPRSSGVDSMAEYYDTMAVDTTVQRLDAIPVNDRKSIFMGAKSF